MAPDDVVKRELRTPGGLVKGGAAGPPVGRAGCLLHDVLRQGEQALLGLLYQVCLDIVATKEVVSVLPMPFLHLIVTI